MDNKEILDDFGKLLISNLYDDALTHFEALKTRTMQWNIGKEYSDVLDKLSNSDKDILFKYLKEVMSTSIFSFLQIFEENTEFKIIYEKDKQQTDLNKISEMLKSEHHGENGWIEKFSKFKDNID